MFDVEVRNGINHQEDSIKNLKPGQNFVNEEINKNYKAESRNQVDLIKKKQSLFLEMNDKVNELNFDANENKDDDRSPIGGDEFGILSDLKSKNILLIYILELKFDDYPLSDNSPIDFLCKMISPKTPYNNENGYPMEYMWKGDGQINPKFYPPKTKVCKDDSNSNTPDSRLNFSTFTTYLENNPMLRYFDNKKHNEGDTLKLNVLPKLTRPESFIKEKEKESNTQYNGSDNDNELDLDKENTNIGFESNLNKKTINTNNGKSNNNNLNDSNMYHQVNKNMENVNNAYINMNVNMNLLNNIPNNYKSDRAFDNKRSSIRNMREYSNSNNKIYSAYDEFEEENEEANEPNNHILRGYYPNTYNPYKMNNFYKNNSINQVNSVNNNQYHMSDNNEFIYNNNNYMYGRNTNNYNNMNYNVMYGNMNPLNAFNYVDTGNQIPINNINMSNISGMYPKNQVMVNNDNNSFTNFKGNYNNTMGVNYFPNINNGIQMGNNFPQNIKRNRVDQNELGVREFKTGRTSKTPLLGFMNMEIQELTKHSYSLAKDQAGCRYLQKKIEEQPEIVNALIYPRIIEHTIELMNDAFGNYLIQKILDYIHDEKMYQILAIISPHLTSLGMNPHGTRVIQKIIDYLKSEELVSCFVKILKPNVLNLIKDINGNHIILKFINQIEPGHSDFIFDIIIQNIVDISTHKHGCCVIQKCIDSSRAEIRNIIIDNLISYSLTLILDQYGNYVVQYILALNDYNYNNKIITGLLKDISYLSKQKYSSNVVEKCFDSCDEETKNKLIRSLLYQEMISDLLLDMYGNYVIQKALILANIEDKEFMLSVIAPLMDKLRFFNFGSKLYNKLIITHPLLSALMFARGGDSQINMINVSNVIPIGNINNLNDYQKLNDKFIVKEMPLSKGSYPMNLKDLNNLRESNNVNNVRGKQYK